MRLATEPAAVATLSTPEVASRRRARAGGAPGAQFARHAVAAAVLALQASLAAAAPLPTGGQISAGSGAIVQNGSTLTIQQDTARLVASWQTFDIAAGSTVRFVQPSAGAVALNRVLGADVSSIQGSLQANGQVFLLNPNGVLFGAGARVNTGGLVASTLAMSDADFLAGRYRLVGASTAAVENRGSIDIANGGGAALVAARVINEGSISADRGQVALVSASDLTLDLGGPVPVRVARGAVDSLVDNGGALRADGGLVLLSARAADELSSSAINHRGVARAQTLASGERGEILLLGDMDHGTLHAAGTLDASAPAGGAGGFVETSAARVDGGAGLRVNAGARDGRGGLWLIDPYDYTIDAAAASQIVGALNSGTSVTVTTATSNASYGATGSGSGDITVSSAITKTAGGSATLTLRADRNITVGASIGSTSGALGITLSAANNAAGTLGGVAVNANLSSNGGRILIGGGGGSLSTASSFGIGYALNSSASTPAVKIGGNVSVASAGGDITINGQSAATGGGSYSGTAGGIYVLSGATIDTGGGNLYMSGISTAHAKVFGFGLEASSGTTTTFRTSSSSGLMLVDSQNLQNSLGALGLTSNGSQARIQFWAPSVAHFLFRINGSNQAATFTQSPPCNPGYPNCGTMVIPGGNQSYTSAGYNVVSSAMLPIYVITGTQSRVYDGSNDASDAPLSTLGGPVGFSAASLGSLAFSTSSKNAGSYDSLSASASNPTSYQSGTYAVAYFSQGTYTITAKTLNAFSAGNKVYDGTTAANVSASGVVGGDAVTITATGGFQSANVGNGITVNVTGVSLSGADAGNYVVGGGGNITTTANITPAPLTVTANNASKTYDGLAYSGNAGVSYSGFVNGETASVLSGSVSYGGTSQGATNAGSYTITPSGLSSSNYSISFSNGSLTVNPAALTVTASNASKTYDGLAYSGGAGVSYSGFVNGETASVLSGSVSYGGTAQGATNAGSYTITPSGLSASNYSIGYANGSLTVNPAALTVTASNASKTYDGLAYSGGAGVSYSGFVNGETASVLSGSVSYGGTSQGATNAGSYTITPSGLSASNYSISYGNGSLTVSPAALTVTASNASKTYDGLAYSGGAGVSYSGFVNGETASVLSGSVSYGGTSQGATNAGSYTITPSGLSASNYSISFSNGSLTVNPAALTVTASNASKTYDGLAYSGGAGVSYSGFVNGETASVLSGSVSYGGTAQGATNAGSYTITPSGLSASNYSISYGNGSLTVNPAALTVTASNASKTYDGLAYSGGAGVSYSGFVNGETASVLSGSVSYGGTAQGATNAGSYTITPSGLTASNYSISYANGSLTVNPAALTVTASNASKTYDGLAYSGGAGVSYSGFVNGETASVLSGSVSYGGTSQGATNAGSYTITPSGLSASNYSISFSNGSLTVNPAALTVTASNASKTYDGLAYSGGAGVSYSGFVNGETASVLSGSVSYSGPSQGATNAGSYAITPSGLSASNYTISYADGSLTVNPATLTYTANAASRTYGAANPALGGTVSGFVNGETLASATSGTPSFTTAATATSNVGNYAIDGSGLTANHGNYVFVQAAGNAAALTIDPAVLTVTAGNASKTYDGLAYSGGAGVSYSGFVNGETASVLSGSVSYGGTSQGATNAGSYTITPSGLSASNYSIGYANGSLTVNPAALTVTASNASKTYDGLAYSGGAGVSYSGFVNGETASVLSGSVSYGGTSQGATDAGTYAITPSGLSASNYTISYGNGSLTVNPAALTVTASNASKTYDGLAYSGGAGVSYSGFVNGETASVLSGSVSYSGTAQGATNAGSYTITPSGLSASNYAISYGNGSLTVSPAALTVTASNASKTYDGLAYSGGAGVSYSGFVNGETASVLSGSVSFGGTAQGATNAGSYTITPSGLSASNYAISYANGSLTVNPAALTVTAANASKTYDGLAYSGGAGVSYSGFVNGETASVLSGSVSYGGTSQGASNAGTYAITPSGLSASNYSISYGNGSLTVHPAALTVTASNASKTYDGLAYNGGAGVSYSGFVNGETASVLSGSVSYGGTAQGATNAGSYTITPSGLSASNYSISFSNGSLTVNPAALTVTASNASKTYDGLAYSGGAGVSYSGFVNGETASVLSGSVSYGGTSQGATNAGSYTITPSGLSASNYSISYGNGSLTVSPAALTVTASNASKTYDGLAYSGGAGVSYSGFVNGETASVLSGSVSYGGTSQGATNAGSYTITPSGLSASNYSISFSNGSLTVNPAALTVTASNASKTYDGLAYSGGAGVSYSGFVNGETASVLSGSVSYGGTAQGATNAGSYTITPSGLTASNYSISYANGSLTVNPATLTYTASAASRTYGAANPALGGTVSGFVNGETLASATSGAPSFTTAATATSNVGSYAIDGSGLTANHGNYVFVQAAGNAAALTIDPAALTITASNASKTYDGLAYSGGAGVSYSGFVNGETASVLSGSVSYSGTAQGATNAGNYTITPSGLSASNYSISYANGSLTVNPATLTYTASAASRTYGAANPTLGGTVSGFVNGETLASATSGTPSFTTAATATSNVGNYAIDGSGLTANHGNYVFVQAAGNAAALTIDPAVLTVTAGNASKTYDGLAYSGGAGVSYSGFVNGETASVLSGSVSYGGTSQGATNAGSYTITPSGLSASNYSISYANGSLTVNPATLTYTASAASRTYGAANPTLGGTVSGFVNGETLASATSGTPSFTTAATAASNVGNYAIDGSGLTANHGNYVFVQAAGNAAALTIDPAALTITASNASKTYDGLAYSGGAGVSYSGFVNGETASVLGGSVTYGGSSQGAVNAGSYSILPQGLTAANYSITFAGGNLTIDPATLSVVTAALTGSSSKVYDGTTTASLVPANFLLGGFVGSDGATVTRSSGSFADPNVGSGKTISVELQPGDFVASGSTNLSNYVLPTSASGAIGHISPATLTYAAQAASRSYGGPNPVLTGHVSGFVNGETLAGATTGAAAFTSAATGTSGVGSYAIEGAGLVARHGNYVFVQAPGNASALSITPAPLNVTAADAAKTYDGLAYSGGAGVGFSGFVNGESASVLGGSLSYGGTAQGAVNAGSYAITPSGLSSPNYAIHYASGNLTVNRAALTVTAANATKVYDGQAFSGGAGASYAGLVNGETVSVLGGGLGYTGSSQGAVDAGSYAITPAGLSSVNYAISYVAGNLTVNPATLTYTAAAASRSYGAGNPALGGTVTGFVNGETLASATTGTVSYTTTAGGTSAVGSYAVEGGGLAANRGNYVFVQAPGNASALSITPAPLNVTAADATKTYDGLAYSGGAGVGFSGFVNGESASVLGGSLSYRGAAQGAVNAGSYAITPAGLSSPNYAISYVAGSLTVNPATLTYTAAAASRRYGAGNPALGGSVTGFVNGETLASATTGTVSYTTTAGGTSAVGSYAIEGSGLVARHGNYVFVQAPGNATALVVSAAPATADALLPRSTPVPTFPDNAAPALLPTAAVPDFGQLNYVPLSAQSPLVPPLLAPQLVAPAAASPAAAAAPTALVAAAIAPVPTIPDATTAAASPATPAATVAPAPAAASVTGSGSGTGAGTSASTGSAPAPAPAPGRNARTGPSGIPVSSANGPLDVFVVEGGINTTGAPRPAR